MKESLIHTNQPVVTDDQPPEVLQPRKRSFNLVTTLIMPHFAAIMVLLLFIILPIGTDQINASFGQSLPKRITVIALVSDNPLRIFSRTPASRTWYSNRVDSCLQQGYLTRRGRIEMSTDRDALAIDHHHPLCTVSTFGLSDTWAPFLPKQNCHRRRFPPTPAASVHPVLFFSISPFGFRVTALKSLIKFLHFGSILIRI